MTADLRLAPARVGDPNDRTMADRLHALTARQEALARHMAEWQRDRMVWEDRATEIVEPFGLDWSTLDPVALDLLRSVEIDGEHWRWTGRVNKMGSPIVAIRSLNTQRSAQRWIHNLLASEHAPPGAMHPRCDAEFVCVRPSHRCPSCTL